MGRLIDIDVLFDYFGNDAIDKTTRSNIEYFVSEKGTAEAIPKDQYKADMVAILEELDSEIQEQIAFIGDVEEANGMRRTDNLVKDKINALKQSIWQDNCNVKKEAKDGSN